MPALYHTENSFFRRKCHAFAKPSFHNFHAQHRGGRVVCSAPCANDEIDPATGLMFGEITPIENAGQVNAYMTLNIRGKRSKTDPTDNDPKMLDALETARAQDA